MAPRTGCRGAWLLAGVLRRASPPTACAPRRRQSAARRKRRSSSSRSLSPSSRSSPAPAPSLSPLPVRVWASVPSQSCRRARPRAMQMATPSRRISRHRRTIRKTVLPLPIRPRTPKTNRRAPIPLRPTVARRPARPTQAKRLTVHSRTREARRATPRRERARQTVTTPTARAEPLPARHLTTRAKARHRATKHVCLSQITDLYNGRESKAVRARLPWAPPWRTPCDGKMLYMCKEEICHEQDNS